MQEKKICLDNNVRGKCGRNHVTEKKKLNKSKRSALYTEILKNSYERLITDERVRSDMEGQKGKKTVIF